jgi:hypothetical protein
VARSFSSWRSEAGAAASPTQVAHATGGVRSALPARVASVCTSRHGAYQGYAATPANLGVSRFCVVGWAIVLVMS